jgi:hypothetical protein
MSLRTYTVQQTRLQACIREHAGLSVDEVMSLLPRFRVGSRSQSAPWLSLGPGSVLICNIKFWDPFLLSNECLRELFWNYLTGHNVTATFYDFQESF